MPGQIVLVHSSAGFASEAALALRDAGYQVAAFTDPMAALDALDVATAVELLITRVNYPSGKPNGVALALMARNRRPDIRVIFIARAEMRQYAHGIGEFLRVPVAIADLVAVVRRLLQQPTAPVRGALAETVRDPIHPLPVSNVADRSPGFSWSARRLLQFAANAIARANLLRNRSAESPLGASHRHDLARAAKAK